MGGGRQELVAVPVLAADVRVVHWADVCMLDNAKPRTYVCARSLARCRALDEHLSWESRAKQCRELLSEMLKSRLEAAELGKQGHDLRPVPNPKREGPGGRPGGRGGGEQRRQGAGCGCVLLRLLLVAGSPQSTRVWGA